MTALQLNAELYREDPTLMTKEEFFARVDKAKEGPSRSFANVEELDKFIRNM